MRTLKLKIFNKPEIWLVGAIFLYIGIFSYLSCLRYWAGFANEWEDISWINNLYWNMIHGNWDIFYKSYIAGTLVDFHPSIAIFLFPFFYALMPNIYFIILTPTMFIALTAWPLFKIAKRVWNDERSALVFAIAFLFYAPKHSIAFVEDETLFIIPFLAFAFYAGLQKRLKMFFFLNCLVATAKTESALYSVLLSFYFLWEYRQTPKFSAMLKQAIFFVFWASVYLIYEVRANSGIYLQSGERDFNFKNIYEVLILLAPLLFLPIRNRIVLLAAPGIALLVTKKFFLPQQSYYLGPAIVFFFIAFIFVLEKTSLKYIKSFRPLLAFCLIFCVLSNLTPHLIGNYLPVTDQSFKKINNLRFLGKNNLFDAEFYRVDPRIETMKKIIPQILESESVSATGDLLPYVPPRRELYEVFDPFNDFKRSKYILISKIYQGFGAGNYYWTEFGTEPFIEELKHSLRYEMIIDENNLVAFRRL